MSPSGEKKQEQEIEVKGKEETNATKKVDENEEEEEEEESVVQAAGHGLIRPDPGRENALIKPTTRQEHRAYEIMFQDESMKNFREFLPHYHCSWPLSLFASSSSSSRKPRDTKYEFSLSLENLCNFSDKNKIFQWSTILLSDEKQEEAEEEEEGEEQMKQNFKSYPVVAQSLPSVLDLKIGRFYHHRQTAFGKYMRQMRKDSPTTGRSIGLRVVGVRHSRLVEDTLFSSSSIKKLDWSEDKTVGRNICPAGLLELLAMFTTLRVHSNAGIGREPVCEDDKSAPDRFDPFPEHELLNFFYSRIQQLCDVIDSDKILDRYSFASSSVLFLHQWQVRKISSGKFLFQVKADLRLVDFSSSGPVGGFCASSSSSPFFTPTNSSPMMMMSSSSSSNFMYDFGSPITTASSSSSSSCSSSAPVTPASPNPPAAMKAKVEEGEQTSQTAAAKTSQEEEAEESVLPRQSHHIEFVPLLDDAMIGFKFGLQNLSIFLGQLCEASEIVLQRKQKMVANNNDENTECNNNSTVTAVTQ